MKPTLLTFLILLTHLGFSQSIITGNAEDLWGNRININDTIKAKTTVIVPFSASNCGYCLIDGYFTETNYLNNNRSRGGAGFEQCLFNPQLDIYVFNKQFHSAYPVLTYPPELHNIHDDGFPTVLAFKDGKQVVKYHYNYAEFPKLDSLLWDNKCKLTPTGNIHMATRLLYENEVNDAIFVYPDNMDIEGETDPRLAKSVSWKHISELTESDKLKNLCFKGNHDAASLSDFFKGNSTLFRFSKDSLTLGDYRFSFDSIGILAWFINPFNSEKYIVLSSRHENKLQEAVNYMDFVIYEGKDSASFKKIMYGHYDIADGKQCLTPQKTFSDIPLQQYCDKICHIPDHKRAEAHKVSEKIAMVATKSPYGIITTLGNGNCRFPDIISDKNGAVWMVYEENGDIILNKVENSIQPVYIEADNSDSYNQILAGDGKRIWVFYLSNKDTYYRVYTRYLENGNLSDELLLSEEEPFNSSHLRAASEGDEISIAWSEWKANQRYLKLIKITNGIVQKPSVITLAPSQYIDDYHNAWSPALTYDSGGMLWGAWNQHYPGNFCTVAGKIGDSPQPVTKTAKKMDDWESGGYPDISSNGEKKILAYESSAWDIIFENKSQKIKFREYDEVLKQWSVPVVLSDPEMYMNQTPSIGCDKNKDIYVVWSAREKKENSVWGIYITINNTGNWSKPLLISQPGLNARHPKIIINEKDNSVWVSWHAGTGERMKAEVMRLKEE